MAVHFHEEDLPAERDVRRRADRRRHRGDGPDARPRPAVPGAIVGRQGRRASRPLRARQRLFGAEPQGAARRSEPRSSSIISRASTSASCSAYLGIMAAPLYCTRTASRLVRTYTDRHGLKDLVKELLGNDLRKQQQTSDWGADELSDAQREYAASDVRYLHALKEKLDERLEREEPHRAGPGLLRLPARRARCSTSPAGPSRTFSPTTAECRDVGRNASARSSSAGRCRAAATTGWSAAPRSRCRARSAC